MTRVFKASDYRILPWKNGRGVTREIYRIDEGQNWAFRISSADVSDSGPFSDFAGYDRTIVNLGPGTMDLESEVTGYKRLSAFEVHHFDGGEQTNCQVSEPGRDLNIFCKRGQFFASVISRRLDRPEFVPVPPSTGMAVYVCSGSLVVQNNQRREFYLQAGETIVREPSDAVSADRWMIVGASDVICTYVAVSFHATKIDQ